MSQSLSDILLHIIFSTKHRSSWIDPSIENELYSYIRAICKDLNCPVIEIGGIADHVHILVSFGRTITLSDLISKMKANSSRWMKTKGNSQFCWQRGFGAFSVARRNLGSVRGYIVSQKEHHKTKSFKEEFLEMLNQANIKFDEKYLWD